MIAPVSALGVLALVLGLLVFVVVTVRDRPDPDRAGGPTRIEGELRQELGPGVRRLETVQGLGLRSAGRGQVRGTGTPRAHRRRAALPPARSPSARRPFHSPPMTDVGKERSWLGKWVGRPLLRVTWVADGGAEDAMAWQVRDLDAWLAALNDAVF